MAASDGLLEVVIKHHDGNEMDPKRIPSRGHKVERHRGSSVHMRFLYTPKLKHAYRVSTTLFGGSEEFHQASVPEDGVGADL